MSNTKPTPSPISYASIAASTKPSPKPSIKLKRTINPYTKFDINDFFHYYKDPSNPYIFTDNHNYITHFYDENNIEVSKPLSQRYIKVNGEKLYITNYYDDENVEHMLFTIPNDVSGVLWDDHYHFGLETNYKSNRNTRRRDIEIIPAIFFHKTIQRPFRGKKDAPRCHFYEKAPLYRIGEIKCVSDRKKRMKHIFPTNTPDFIYIKEIIERPFYRRGGGGKKTRKNIKKTRKIRKKMH